ncbi:DUF423 domain-containing protein [Ulvibacterium marinum]|uniref:DUF423 domain-containing protein n=1 Tax=Ulvibacterium marinum TaxID=2419782 RepID=UPI002494C0D0|nr:DUF423 domain-containing protein [Ulvibacterium marinum]
MNRTIFLTGAILGLLAVLLGAFGAHGLGKLVDVSAIKTFETGVKYQMYHALFLLILANVYKIPEQKKKWVFYIVLIGVILFSFSIYALATNSLTSIDFKSIAFLTPIGGTLLVLGWILLGYHGFKSLK